MKNIKKSKGFTLVELLIVIAIIGILAAMIMPNLGSVMGKGSQMKAQNAARSIAQAWIQASKSSAKPRMIVAPDIYGWAVKLAKWGDMNEPSMWLLDFDEAVMMKQGEGAPMPLSVLEKQGNVERLNPEFKAYPVSWEVANMSPNAPNGTPLVWTRGLKPNGYWDTTNMPVFKDGGIMAFTDGHVQWFTSLIDENSTEQQRGVLKVFNGTNRTFNIAQAVGGSAKILKSNLASE